MKPGNHATSETVLSDDYILALWRTIRPSIKQDKAMVYQTGPLDIDRPTYELRRLVELAIECGRRKESGK